MLYQLVISPLNLCLVTKHIGDHEMVIVLVSTSSYLKQLQEYKCSFMQELESQSNCRYIQILVKEEPTLHFLAQGISLFFLNMELCNFVIINYHDLMLDG